MKLFRLFFLAAAFSSGVFCPTGFADASNLRGLADCKDCNVILISLDTLRADALGTYGSKFGASPALDRAARRAFVFMNAYSPAPMTLPSHMTVFSSLHPSRHRVSHAWMQNQLSPNAPLLAESLKAQGYRTAWTFFWPYPAVDPMLRPRAASFKRGFDAIINESAAEQTSAPGSFEWLEKNADGKFFLFVHHYGMHNPYAPSRASMSAFSKRLREKRYMTDAELIRREQDLLADDPQAASRRQGKSPKFYFLRDRLFWSQFDLAKPGDQEDLKTLYMMNLHDVDRWFSSLWKELDKLKILDKTLIVIMADHGEEFMEHGAFLHTTMHEECLRVPLLFLLPGGKGGRREEMAGLIDIFPTIIDVLGGRIPDGLQGISLKPLMEGNASGSDRVIYGDHRVKSNFSIRDSSYAYILERSEDMTEKLYDRINDRGETRNLIAPGVPGADAAQKIADRYRRLMRAYQNEN